MLIKNIELVDFRNYSRAKVCFDDNLNVIIGDNAQGKTNLLEGIFYLTVGRSFRSRTDGELIRFGSESFDITADIYSQERNQKLRVFYAKGRRKQLFANNVKLKTASELSGKLTAVLFSPDDLYIIKEGAAQRRRLMDNCLSQLRPKYAASLSEFKRVYERKTRILRDFHEKPSLLAALDEYDMRLAQMSANLIYMRAYFVDSLNKHAKKIHYDFSGGLENLDIKYKTIKTIDDPKKRPEELFEIIMEHQKNHRRAELDSGLCLSGAHKDDLEIYINGNAAKNYASQGQTRTAALSIKLAEREIHKSDKGEYPILLLDDVLSELDGKRQEYILSRIKDGQIFITCCEDGRAAAEKNGKIIRISKGEIL